MVDFHVMLSSGFAGDGMDAASALRYASLAGLRFIGLTIPCDGSDLSRIGPLAAHVRRLSLYANVEARTGVELRHVPPALLPDLVLESRKAGAELVVVYGETLCDQVEPGTNVAAIEAGADILAHPGLIDDKCAGFAAERGVALEFTSCPIHALANAHTAAMALHFGAPLVRGSAAKCASDMSTRSFWPQVIRGSNVFGEKDGKSNLLELIDKSEYALIKKLMHR